MQNRWMNLILEPPKCLLGTQRTVFCTKSIIKPTSVKREARHPNKQWAAPTKYKFFTALPDFPLSFVDNFCVQDLRLRYPQNACIYMYVFMYSISIYSQFLCGFVTEWKGIYKLNGDLYSIACTVRVRYIHGEGLRTYDTQHSIKPSPIVRMQLAIALRYIEVGLAATRRLLLPLYGKFIAFRTNFSHKHKKYRNIHQYCFQYIHYIDIQLLWNSQS